MLKSDQRRPMLRRPEFKTRSQRKDHCPFVACMAVSRRQKHKLGGWAVEKIANECGKFLRMLLVTDKNEAAVTGRLYGVGG
ncbi:hypothetical protein ABIC32_001379 [Brevundimonas sp. 1080]